jgi:hypothetical protein
MNLIGDLERLFATSLYPLRVPIAIGLGVALVGAVLVARRRGWLAAAARHPGRTAALAVVALAITLPIAWYLASPLFIRTELVEPLPAAASESATPAPAVPSAAPMRSPERSSTPSVEPSEAPTLEPTPFEPATLVTGSFRGADDFHFGTGTARIIETTPGRFTLRFEDFSVRNGPDLYVYLSPDAAGYADGALELGTLKATDGSFGYELPPDTNPADYASAVIWCKQFAVLFAIAPLASS